MFRSIAKLAAIAAAGALLAAAPQSFSRDELDALLAEKRDAERQLAALKSAADAAGGDMAEVEARLIAAAMESRRREEQAREAELRLSALGQRQAAAHLALRIDSDALEELLAALAAAGRSQPPALVVRPRRANDAVRSAILMGDAAPALSDRAQALAGEIETLNALERDIRLERARLEAAEATLAVKRAEIERLAAVKRAQYEDVSGDAETLRKQVAALAKEADTLQELLAGLEDQAPVAPKRKPTLTRLASLTPKGRVAGAPDGPGRVLEPLGPGEAARLRQPAAGLVAKAFGDPEPAGLTHEGLTIATRRAAQVTAPADGVIEYADTFRSYGPTLILRTTDGYHVVLSGLSSIYGVRGQQIAAGEPVGRMPDREQPAPELYIELVKDRKKLDPAKWMRSG